MRAPALNKASVNADSNLSEDPLKKTWNVESAAREVHRGPRVSSPGTPRQEIACGSKDARQPPEHTLQ